MNLIFMIFALHSCGQDHGYLFRTKPVQINDDLGHRQNFTLAKRAYDHAVWHVPCDTTDRAPAAKFGELVIVDRQFEVIPQTISGTSFSAQGRVCDPQRAPRDIIVAIDVSTSMGYRGVDPPSGSACRRLTTLQAIFDAAPPSSQFGVITFADTVVASSTKLHESKAALINELTQGGRVQLSSVICRWDGRSAFDNPLQRAADLLASGRERPVQKEIYLMTDGDAEIEDVSDPRSHLAKAISLAADLKSKGITINGQQSQVQIAGLLVDHAQHDRFLSKSVSKDYSGDLLLGSTNAVQSVFSRMTRLGQVIAPVVISLTPLGATTPLTFDVVSQVMYSDTFDYDIGPLFIDPGASGYGLSIQYTNAAGTQQSVEHKIFWKPL
jgi:hypothetical protein